MIVIPDSSNTVMQKVTQRAWNDSAKNMKMQSAHLRTLEFYVYVA